MNTKSKNLTKYCMGMKPRLGRALHNESGAALIVALLLMVAMISIIPVAMHMTAADIKRTANFADSRDAFFIADAGIEHVKAIYQNTGSNTALEGTDQSLTADTDNGTFFTAGGTGPTLITGASTVNVTSVIDDGNHEYTQVDFNGGNYKIRIWDNDDEAILAPECASPCASADPLWNQANEAWVDRDGVVYAESIGTSSDGTTKTIYGTLKRKNVDATTVPAALTLVGPKATYRSNSNAGKVKGADGAGGSGFGIDGSSDTDCNGKEGVVMEAENTPNGGDWTNLTNPNAGTAELATCVDPAGDNNNACFGWSPANSINDVEGTASNIVTGSTDFTALDAEKLFDDFVVDNTPDQTLTAASTKSDITSWGTKKDPVVIHAKDNLTISSNTVGYGVLVVDGTLDLGGTITWNGIIIISGCDNCEGSLTGSGGFTVNGAIIIGNDGLDTGGIDDTISVSDYGGTANYVYSCEGIDIANGAFNDSFTTVAWNEITK